MAGPKFVNALNTSTGQRQTVPAHYVDNPRIFGGAFTVLAEHDPSPAAGEAVETPVAVEAAPITESDPATGAPTTTEE